MTSPFTPYLGRAPKVFVGRDIEIKNFKTALSDAKEGKPSSILLVGHRGMGKTVLLKYFASIAKELGFYTIYIALDESSDSPSALAQKIYGKVKASFEDEFINLKAKKFIKRIKPKISVRIDELEISLGASL
ncbi:MAG: hypothetical protein DRN12_05215 [Thermoplasmata archaeon]|nr:MAG: hypothetical protein DRN12_05215 [Thermoplasmata archaeon]